MHSDIKTLAGSGVCVRCVPCIRPFALRKVGAHLGDLGLERRCDEKIGAEHKLPTDVLGRCVVGPVQPHSTDLARPARGG